MATQASMLPLLVAIPLGVAFILPVFHKMRRSAAVADFISVAAAGALFIITLSLLGVNREIYWVGRWSPESIIGIGLYADGLSKLLLLIINTVSLAAVLFSIRYMVRYTSRILYFSLFMLMIAGMNGVVITGDMFNLFVFLEIASIASYSLVAFGCESEELEASFKYLILGSIASTLILFGIGMLYNQTGFLNMAQLSEHFHSVGMSRVTLMAGCFFIVGFGLKAAMVPFHAWLPDAHPSAPAPISAMLSGVLIKALGIYVLARLFLNIFPVSHAFAVILMILGAASMLIAGLLAIPQADMKRLLAYSSISQMGYVVMALGIGAGVLARGGSSMVAGLALFGALFHLFNHSAFKSLLFLASGAIEYATGTRQLREMGGLRKRMPVTGVCCRIAALSIAGIPPFNGFWSKLIIIIAAFQAGHPWLAALAVLVAFLTLVSFVKVQRYALDGELPERYRNIKEVPAFMGIGMAILALICVAAGILFLSYPLNDIIMEPAREALLKTSEYARLVLGGL